MTVLDTDLISAFLKPDADERYPRLLEFVTELLGAEGLSIAYVTQFELRRGFEELRRKGQGLRLMVRYEKLLARCEVLGLDGESGAGWDLAARLWADGRAKKPAICLRTLTCLSPQRPLIMDKHLPRVRVASSRIFRPSAIRLRPLLYRWSRPMTQTTADGAFIRRWQR